MSAWLLLVLLSVKLPIGDASLHKIDVRIAGPLAMVDVWRSVEAKVRTSGARQLGNYVDLSLPKGAALLDWELIGEGGSTQLLPRTEVEANAGLSALLKMRHLSPPPAPADEGTDYRIHVTPISGTERAILHYRFSALADCRDGQLVLRMPGSLEEDPAPADVNVIVEPSADGTSPVEASLADKPVELQPGARKTVVKGLSPARAPWEIAWRYAKPTGSLPGTVVAAAARIAGIDNSGKRPHKVPQYALSVLACGASADREKQPPPDRVILLVDRSRSVGQGGLSVERVLARQMMEALPPSVSFNGILFGAEAEPVFQLPRIPTREALQALVAAADPNRLENGTDVVEALGRAKRMLDGGTGPGGAWVVLITDGALPASQTHERMRTALAAADGKNPRLLVLLVRQQGDEEVSASVVAEYAQLVRKFGGVVRVVAANGTREAAHRIVNDMSSGGDLLDLRVEDHALSLALSAAKGAGAVLETRARLPRDRRVRISASWRAGEVQAAIKPVTVKPEWIEPLLERRREKRLAWSGATEGMAVAVLPGPQSDVKPVDGVVRGRMDPLVLRNALALAFTPRARACYLSRRAVKAGDAYLRGRLKLELTLERGELHDAVVRQSTLGKPEIEHCVSKAAWAVNYPRPEHRDAPTIANVNLVFAPRTSKERQPDASPMDREIDLILGPLTFPGDFTDLLDDRPAQEPPAGAR